MSSTTEELPSHTYAVLVHRQHAVRVRDALERTRSDNHKRNWTTLIHDNQSNDGDASSSTGIGSSLDHGGIGDIESLPPTEKTTCIAYASTREAGPRKARTGYNMLVVRNAVCSPSDLPPLARQHISWAGTLTHRTGVDIDDATIETIKKENLSPVNRAIEGKFCYAVAGLAFRNLKEHGFVFAENETRRADELRLDVRPKSFALPLIQHLQFLAEGAEIPDRADMDPNDPYDGPIRMTQSMAKSAFVLCAVFDDSSTTTELRHAGASNDAKSWPTTCYWGVSPSAEHAYMLNRLNDFAKKEVQMAKPNDATCDDDTPTSRAYYKLSQIFEEHLPSSIMSAWETDGDTSGAALDLGASPGGWTQVLWENKLRPVVSVDPGLLAPRVERLEWVHHIQGDFDGDDEVIRRIADRAPYAAIVCDANITHGIDDKIKNMVGRVVVELGRSEEEGGKASAVAPLLSLPAVFVLTLKFPYKSGQSMKRNYASATKMIPDLLRSIVDAQYRVAKCNAEDITCRYTVVHLHANSDSERTVIAIFDRTSEVQNSKRKRASTTCKDL